MVDDLLQFYKERPGEARQVSIRVTVEQDEFVKELAKKLGVKRADIWRLALEEWLKTGPHAKVAQEIAKKRSGK